MPTCNGHPVETGCYAEGHRGWYGPQRVIELAIDLGWELDAEGQAAVADYFEPTGDQTDDEYGGVMEVVVGQGGIADEAEAWLNDHTHAERKSDGADLTWSEVEGAFMTATGEVVPYDSDDVQSYVWHWHDGEFFLSRICQEPETCTDDECACHD